MLEFETILNYIGGGGPIILFFSSLYLLWSKPNLLFYYVIGVFTNSLLNILLKGIIQQPRPSENEKLFNLALANAKKDVFKNGIPFDTFGMPSGHAQSVLFSTVYIYLALQKQNILFIYLLVSVLTMYQRVYNNYHTIFQIIVGSIVGTLFAGIVFHFSQQKVKGRIREKHDDFGPIFN
jgi:membrane-associated phospholipid phosphatase